MEIKLFGKLIELFNKQKISQWLKCRGLQLPKRFTIESIKLNSKILTENDFVKSFNGKINKSLSVTALPKGYVSVFGKQMSLFGQPKEKQEMKYTEPFGDPERFKKQPAPRTTSTNNEQIDMFKSEEVRPIRQSRFKKRKAA